MIVSTSTVRSVQGNLRNASLIPVVGLVTIPIKATVSTVQIVAGAALGSGHALLGHSTTAGEYADLAKYGVTSLLASVVLVPMHALSYVAVPIIAALALKNKISK
jgi:hypothetical protein